MDEHVHFLSAALAPNDVENLDDLVEFVEPPTHSDSDIEIIESTPRATKPFKSTSAAADEDRAVALALQKQRDREDGLAQERAAETEEKSLWLIERLQHMDASMAEKRQKLAQSKDVPDDGIVFQVVIDADGKTLEGDEDPDNAAQLEPPRLGLEIYSRLHSLDIVKHDFEQALAGGLKLKNGVKEILTSFGINTTEKNLFRGSVATNIQPIFKNGFLIPGVSPGVAVVNGAACGLGIHLSTTPLISLGYIQGANKMFMCRVVIGRSMAQVSQAIPGRLEQNGFESWSGPGMCVSKHVELVVARYVVKFEMNWYLGGGIAAMVGALRMAANPFGILPAGPSLGAPPAARGRKKAAAKPKPPSKRTVKGASTLHRRCRS
ncbi:hypothetical protein B0H17DRAFT_1186364 [Mycena rosella]|uniref:Uncharacterized protein n=1 Tax=Mycena rosella TaxID=1033263 RepID=A0AAD7G2P4_MYCRO|nr:hypothetical protein B0H17DRAFT_1186364 [Mycena rosella]